MLLNYKEQSNGVSQLTQTPFEILGNFLSDLIKLECVDQK